MQIIDKQIPDKNRRVAKLLLLLLTALMCIRISGYFSYVPDAVGLTRAIKIGLRFATTGAALFLLWAFSRRHDRFEFRFLMILPLIFYLAYLFMGLLSIYWTTNVSFSLLQLSMTIETLVFSFFFIRLVRLYDGAFNWKMTSFIFIVNRSVFFLAIIFLAGAFFDPDFFYRETHGGTVKRLGGLIINPNELGLLSLVGITLSYIELHFRKNKWYNGISLVVCIAVLLMTQSRSSLFAFLLVSGIFLLLSKSYLLKAGAIAAGILLFPVVIKKIVFKDGNVQEVTSFTGRTEFWSDLLVDAFPKRPLHGYGFMSISTNTFYNKYESRHSYAASMAHNTYIEVLINLGLIGAFICLLQMILTFFAVFSSKENILKMMAFFMLLPLLINSLTEFGIFGHTNYAIMFYQFVFLFFSIGVVERSKTSRMAV